MYATGIKPDSTIRSQNYKKLLVLIIIFPNKELKLGLGGLIANLRPLVCLVP